jgi:YVTN family beta-propeller protein
MGILAVIGLAASAAEIPKYHEIKRIAVGGEGGWDYLTCDSAAHRLYVSRGTHVTVVDLEKDSVSGDIPNTPGVHGIAIAPRLHRGFTSNGRDNSVTVFDTETLKEIEKVKVGMNPDCIIFDRASNRVFTFNGGSNDATAIDVATNKVAGTIALGGRPEYAVTDRNGEVFVNIEDKNEIVAIDSKAMSVKSRWSIAPGDGPSGLAMDLKNRRLFAVCGNDKMVVMDADSGKVVATPAIGKGPDAAQFDGGLAFSSNGQDGTLTVIKEEADDKFTVVATVPTQRSARTMALDSRSHNIYLAAAKFQAAPAAPAEAGAQRRRPPMEPNSFVILVYGP